MLKAQLVANESGDVFVPSYDWQEKLGHFRPVPHLKKYHNLIFSNAHPGVVQCYTDSSDKVGESFTVCSDRSVSDKLPTQLYADGLAKSRKDYLFQKIRNFCPDHAKDILFPASEENVVGAEEHNKAMPSPSQKRPREVPKEQAPLSPPTRKTGSPECCVQWHLSMSNAQEKL